MLAGSLSDGRVALRELCRFENRPVRLPDGLRWNLLHLFTEALAGLRSAGPLAGVGVDTWGVDYALLDGRGRVLGLPFHYRDERTAGMVERAFARVNAGRAVRRDRHPDDADQHGLPAARRRGVGRARRRRADRAWSPTCWRSGSRASWPTSARTRRPPGCSTPARGEWAHDAIARLGLPGRLFGPLVDPGTALGAALPHHELGEPTVYAVASHDTASAFAAAPIADEHAAVLSSGTWSLLGLELPEPVLSDRDLTNERGVDGTTRLLKNVMGMWLLEECRRAWGGVSYDELHRLAEAETGEAALFDPDDEALLRPGDMPARIAGVCGISGRGAIVRAILVSLACKYRWVLERLEAVTGREVRRIHVVGGGARNALLCRLTADVTGREVLAGPVEATALGNVLVQARAAGELGSLADMRAVAAASAEPVVYEPGDDDGTYRRFLDVTGLPIEEKTP